ncbi:pyridoxamine 5'-phosphate oxidase family protein [Desulfonatronovibrio hydrogenovorans]|uniref:pyridoxamine 5'-phosphate oxidase family protein n=1 Tax=Desulfonatronovibrio hydrogenovorans TaxID=53245 RepID=UPI00048BEB3F|nr:pyridoxamine 5'-phosphate oxidase family protein [Desulfonatronovibrio hydrogenovorans]
MLEEIRRIIKTSDLAVLATSSENQPHCSLMAYIPDSGCTEIYMLTRKESRKYKYISANPLVSIMIDTRLDRPESRKSIKALTITGSCRPADPGRQEELIKAILARHPQLEILTRDQDAIAIQTTISSVLLLDGVKNAFFTEPAG